MRTTPMANPVFCDECYCNHIIISHIMCMTTVCFVRLINKIKIVKIKQAALTSCFKTITKIIITNTE